MKQWILVVVLMMAGDAVANLLILLALWLGIVPPRPSQPNAFVMALDFALYAGMLIWYWRVKDKP